jgi:hypothetical protein
MNRSGPVAQAPDTHPPPGLIGRLREQIRYRHYSLRTEQAYVHWVRQFIRWSGRRHPRELGAAEVESFLSGLICDRNLSASTHKQALSALLFLYKDVLGTDLPWLNGLVGAPLADVAFGGEPPATGRCFKGSVPWKFSRRKAAILGSIAVRSLWNK